MQREAVQGEEGKCIQSARDNKQTPGKSNAAGQIYQQVLGKWPRNPYNWIIKQEGGWEEPISCVAGSCPIVINKTGVSSGTPDCPQPCDTGTHMSKLPAMSKHTQQGHLGQERGGTAAK